MVSTQDESLTFLVDWYDSMACSNRPFKFFFYPADHSIEILDLKSKKHHLKRIKFEAIQLQDLFVGNTVEVYGRRFMIREFADQVTKELLWNKKERTFALIKPDAYTEMGKIINIIIKHGFSVHKLQMLKLSEEAISFLFPELLTKPYFREMIRFLMSDVVVGLEVVGENALEGLKALVGPANPIQGKQTDPVSIRAVFGQDSVKNAIDCSQNESEYKKQSEIFFGEKCRNCFSSLLTNCTLCLIKPHAVTSGFTGLILDKILSEGFEISAIHTYFLDRATCEDFFELYKGVLPEYPYMIDQMVSGPCVALEVRQEQAVVGFKAICGAFDPEKGRERGEENTIRRLWGLDRVRNAVHCTDVEEEGKLECEFFFAILPERKMQH